MHQEAVGADCPFANGLQHLPGFRFLSTEADRVRCLKRDGGVEFVALDRQDAEDRYKLEPVDALTPTGSPPSPRPADSKAGGGPSLGT